MTEATKTKTKTKKTKTVETVEWVDNGYKIECPVCHKRIQSENADGDWEGGFDECPHLYIAYLCDSGMYHPHYKNEKEVAKITAYLETLKEDVARFIIKDEGLADTAEEFKEVMEYEISEEKSVVYLANHLPENMVGYSVEIPTGGCGGGHWTVENIFIFKIDSPTNT